ncbi:MAG: bifunctional DNA primase/polymerase [Simkania sp.]|nr:bifunctional DNA primase/polymerase [Simkania sp.]
MSTDSIDQLDTNCKSLEKQNWEFAWKLWEAGWAILPIHARDKTPNVSTYNHSGPRLHWPNIRNAMCDSRIAILCGYLNPVYVLDFDHQQERSFVPFCKQAGDRLKGCGIEKTRKGFHIWLRVPNHIVRHEVLSRNANVPANELVNIELLGFNKYCLCPSPLFSDRKWLQRDLFSLQDKNPGDLLALCDLAKTFNQVQVKKKEPKGSSEIDFGSDPISNFFMRMSWNSILEPHGWVELSDNHWRRPGKYKGVSASTLDQVFYLFSSSVPGLEPSQGYSKFAVWTALNFEGDYPAAFAEVNRLKSVALEEKLNSFFRK